MATPNNIIALVKGNEKYFFTFDDDNRTEILRQIGRFVANPELSLNCNDAAVLSQKIREIKKGETPCSRISTRIY